MAISPENPSLRSTRLIPEYTRSRGTTERQRADLADLTGSQLEHVDAALPSDAPEDAEEASTPPDTETSFDRAA